MSEGSKERSPQQLAKSRRDYLAQVKMLTLDERTQEAAKINKALGIKAPSYGRQIERLEGAVVFVLASPSGRARSFWTIEPWKAAAAFVLERRRARERVAGV